MKFVKSFPTTSALTAYLDGAENGYYLLRDESDTGATRIHYEKVINLPYFCIKANLESTVRLYRTELNLQYSLDFGATWVDYTGQTVTLYTGDKMYWRRNSDTLLQGWSLSRWYVTGNIELSGNIHSLLKLNFEDITDISSCSSGLFGYMFSGQTAVTSCSKLIMPATAIGTSCCAEMFKDCSNLTGTAPVLNASVLTGWCYQRMFNGTKINKVISYATDISATACIMDWLGGSGFPATGDFYNLGGATYPSGASGIPSGWTEHTTIED